MLSSESDLMPILDCSRNQIELEEFPSEEPLIAAATGSADETRMTSDDCRSSASSINYIGDNDYNDDIGSQVEISCDEISKRWYQHEHDYLKNEPESSGLEESDNTFERKIVFDVKTDITDGNLEDLDNNDYCNSSHILKQVTQESSSRISKYDTELPQEIFHMPEDAITYQSDIPSTILNNYKSPQADQSSFVVKHQIIDSPPARFSSAVVMQDREPVAFQHEIEKERADLKDARTYRGN